jgi:hypothetical protein
MLELNSGFEHAFNLQKSAAKRPGRLILQAYVAGSGRCARPTRICRFSSESNWYCVPGISYQFSLHPSASTAACDETESASPLGPIAQLRKSATITGMEKLSR